MTFAVISLAVVIATLGGIFLWILREARKDHTMAVATARELGIMRELENRVVKERDAALMEASQLRVERNAAMSEVEGLRELLAELRQEVADAQKASIRAAQPADVPALIDEQLQVRRARSGRPTKTLGRAIANATVSGPGASSSSPRGTGSDDKP